MNDVGLCASCAHCRIIKTRRSRFYLCKRASTDPAFARYPRLPVRVCAGFEPSPEGSEAIDHSADQGSGHGSFDDEK